MIDFDSEIMKLIESTPVREVSQTFGFFNNFHLQELIKEQHGPKPSFLKKQLQTPVKAKETPKKTPVENFLDLLQKTK